MYDKLGLKQDDENVGINHAMAWSCVCARRVQSVFVITYREGVHGVRRV
jgi:hypothetical protein